MEKIYAATNPGYGVKESNTDIPRIQSQLNRIKDVLSDIHEKIYRLNDIHSHVSIEARYDEIPPQPMEVKKEAESVHEKLSDVEDSLLLISNRLQSMNTNLSNLI